MSAADFPHLWRTVKQERGYWYQDIKTDDAWLTIQLAQNNRLVICSDRPAGMKTAGTAERITASLDRTAEAIARDIKARLLPNAREYFQRCREYTRKWKQDQDEHAEILHMLEPFVTWKHTDSDGTRTQWRTDNARADIYTNKIYSMTIDSPTMEQLIKILTIMKGQ